MYTSELHVIKNTKLIKRMQLTNELDMQMYSLALSAENNY